MVLQDYRTARLYTLSNCLADNLNRLLHLSWVDIALKRKKKAYFTTSEQAKLRT